MTAAETNTNPVDPQLLERAMVALLKHHESTHDESKALLGNERPVRVQIGLDRVPGRANPKPFRIHIPHSMYKTNDTDLSLQEPEVCLIVKEDSKPWVQETIRASQMGFVKKVLGLDSLRKKHGRFEQQRALLARFDVFMADDRILPMVGKAIGRHFFRTKKQPIPISLSRKTLLPSIVLRSLRSTHMFLSQGTCVSIRVGSTVMEAKQLVENVQAVVRVAATRIPHQWANIRSVSIKTADSASLPVYNKTPQELQEIAEMAGVVFPQEAKPERKKKKRKSVQSPLLQALKKQKQNEKERSPKDTHDDNTKVEKSDDKKKRESSLSRVEKSSKSDKAHDDNKSQASTDKSVDKEDDDKLAEKKKREASTPKTDTLSKNDDDNKSQASTDKSKMSVDKEDDNKSAEKKKKKREASTPKTDTLSKDDNKSQASTDKSKMSDDNKSIKSAEKKKKKREASTPKTDTLSKNDDDKSAEKKRKKKKRESVPTEDIPAAKQPFISAKEFTGSKQGYVFRTGRKGLGYYKDEKPLVDRMAIQALMQLQPNKKGKKRGRR